MAQKTETIELYTVFDGYLRSSETTEISLRKLPRLCVRRIEGKCWPQGTNDRYRCQPNQRWCLNAGAAINGS